MVKTLEGTWDLPVLSFAVSTPPERKSEERSTANELRSTPMPETFLDNPLPTLFIGLGGSGQDVLLRLKHQLRAIHGPDIFRFAHFLAIDIDANRSRPAGMSDSDFHANQLRVEQGEFVACGISEAEWKRVRDEKQFRGDWSWIHPAVFEYSRNAFADGTGAFRQVGRLAFALKQHQIRSLLLQHLSRLRHQATSVSSPHAYPHVQVFTVASLAGGTGSGMFLDLAYMLREIFQHEPEFVEWSYQSAFIGVLADVFATGIFPPELLTRFRANCYATLADLERTMTVRQPDPLWGETNSSGRVTFRNFVPTWSQKPVSACPWDDCYLIDNVNKFTPHRPSTPSEVMELIADYLRARAGRDELARDLRSRRLSACFVRDRLFLNDVRSRTGLSKQPQEYQSGPVIWDRYHRCYCSTFGCAGIFLNFEQVIRTAALRLISHLIGHLLHQKRLKSETDVREMARADLFSPASVSQAAEQSAGQGLEAISFAPSTLPQEFLKTASDWQKSIRDSFDEAAVAAADSGEQRLMELIERHLRNLSRGGAEPPGAACQEMAARLRELGSAESVPGLCHQQLQHTVLMRLEFLGCDQTVEYLEAIRQELQQIANTLQIQSQTPPTTVQQLLARLRDAAALPTFPFNRRKIAVANEYQIACQNACQWVLARYWAEASKHAESLVNSMRNFLDPQLLPNGLGRDVSPVQTVQRYTWFLGRMERELNTRFDENSRPAADSPQHGLLPEWNPEKYDREILRMLHAESPSWETVTPDSWKDLERTVLSSLSDQATSRAPVSLGAVLRNWMDQPYLRSPQDAVKILVDTCDQELQRRFRVDDSHDGNVLSHLERLSTEARRQLWSQMVQRSAPYLPLTSLPFSSETAGAEHSWSTLGWMKADDLHEVHRRYLWSELNEISLHLTNQPVPTPSDHSPRAVIQIQEMTGIPVTCYARLSELEHAYHSLTTSYIRSFCHLDSASQEELNCLKILTSQEAQWIQEYWQYVLLGIVTHAIQYTQGGFGVEFLTATAGQTPAPRRFLLGHYWDDILQNACCQEEVRLHLQRDWEEWKRNASARDLAVVYSALWQNFGLCSGSLATASKSPPSPLQNGLDILLKELEQNLTAMGEDGQAWLAILKPWDRFWDHDHTERKAGLKRVSELIFGRCLRRDAAHQSILHVHKKGLALITLDECKTVFENSSSESTS